jgi:hypothetical protein
MTRVVRVIDEVWRVWNEEDHPRGQPGNAGQFVESGGGGGEGEFLEELGAGTGGTSTPASGAKASPGVPAKLVKAIEDHVEAMGGRDSKEGAGDLTEWMMRTHRSDMLKVLDSFPPEKRPTLLLHKGDAKTGMPSVWLLGWSKDEGTDIHDHVKSEVGISVLRGKVVNRGYKIDKDYIAESKSKEGLSTKSADTTLQKDVSVTLQAPYIHEMFGTGSKANRDVSLHAYYPPLKQMHYFKKDADGNLHYDGDWDEDRPPEVPRKCICCLRPFDPRVVKVTDEVWREWREEDHPRGQPENAGQFGPGGGGTTDGGKAGRAGGEEGGKGKGGGKHPGKGYSKNAYVDKKGVIQTNDVDDACLALFEDRKVNLKQPREVSTLLNKLGEIAKDMVSKGEKAPNFNLCNVSVSKTNLFCAETKHIPRIKMPQLSDEQTKEFPKWLQKQGYAVTVGTELAANLRATQDELNGAKVAGTAKYFRGNPKAAERPIIVSRDGYILDGHHTWAAKIGNDAADDNLKNDAKMNIIRVDIATIELLHRANQFTGKKGRKSGTESKRVRSDRAIRFKSGHSQHRFL